MSESLKYLGRRQQAALESRELRLLISAVVESLRGLLDPTLQEELLEGEKIAQLGLDLSGKVLRLRELLQVMDKCDSILGR